MTIPLDAIDPDAAYREWVGSFLSHVDRLTDVFVEGTGQLVLPHLRAAKIQERVSGGGYVDNVPVSDSRADKDMHMLWGALRAYLASASSHLGVEAPILPITLPEAAHARAWAYDAGTWLRSMVDHIRAWPDLAEVEATMFRLIDRYSTGQRPDPEPERDLEPAVCAVCGMEAVLIDWVEGRLVKACTVCGTKYLGAS